jgi:hypothetical protein
VVIVLEEALECEAKEDVLHGDLAGIRASVQAGVSRIRVLVACSRNCTCDGLVGWVNLVEYFPHGKGLVEEFCHKFLRGTRAFAVRRGVLSNQSYQTGQCSNRNSV